MPLIKIPIKGEIVPIYVETLDDEITDFKFNLNTPFTRIVARFIEDDHKYFGRMYDALEALKQETEARKTA